MRDWQPGGDPGATARNRRLARERSGRRAVSALLPIDRRGGASNDSLPRPGLSADAVDAPTSRFARLRWPRPIPAPSPAFAPSYLDLIDERLRDGLESIFSEHFEAEPLENYEGPSGAPALLGDWIAAPLAQSPQPARIEHAAAPSGPRTPAPIEPTDAQLAEIADRDPRTRAGHGSPNGKRALPVADTDLGGNELAYVTEAIESNWVSSAGPYVQQLEATFAEYCGRATRSRAPAARPRSKLMLRAGGIGPGDEVIMPTFTMVATANAVHHTGAKVVFVDSDLSTWNMDLEARRRVDRTEDAGDHRDAHLRPPRRHGRAARDRRRQLAGAVRGCGRSARRDAARSARSGRPRRRRRVLASTATRSSPPARAGSSRPTSPEIAEAARDLRSHAFSSDRHFWHRRRAFNYRMSNLQAAVGLAQLERIDEFLERRRELARIYREHLGPIPGITLPPTEPGLMSANWMFGVVLDDDFPMLARRAARSASRPRRSRRARSSSRCTSSPPTSTSSTGDATPPPSGSVATGSICRRRSG